MAICISIMILGVIGNIMVPIVILKTKDMRNSTNIFLTNLSIADLLVLLVCTPTVLVEVNSKPETWVLGHEMCKAVPFIELTVAHASVLTILAISFERYYAICEPLKAGYVCTKTRALMICVIAWAIAALFTSPILSIAKYDLETYIDDTEVAVCLTSVDTFLPSLYFIAIILIFFFIPFLILLILYSIIAKHLLINNSNSLITHNNYRNNNNKNNKRFISGGNNNTVLKYRKQVIFMLGTVVISFFICLLPFRALTLWIIVVPPETIMSLGVERYYNILYFCRIMMYLNSAMNPILYNLMSTKFRGGFFKLLSCGYFRRNKRFYKGGNDRLNTFRTTSTNMSSSTSSSSRRDHWRNRSNSLRNTFDDNFATTTILANTTSTIHSDSVDRNCEIEDATLTIVSIKDETEKLPIVSGCDDNYKDSRNILNNGSIIRKISKKNFDDIKEESDADDDAADDCSKLKITCNDFDKFNMTTAKDDKERNKQIIENGKPPLDQ